MRFERSRLAYAVVGLVLALGVAALWWYALGLDDYYAPSDVSRWEHARRWSGASWFVVGGFVVASATTATCFWRALAPRRLSFAPPLLPAIATYFVAVVTAWYFLTGGH